MLAFNLNDASSKYKLTLQNLSVNCNTQRLLCHKQIKLFSKIQENIVFF